MLRASEETVVTASEDHPIWKSFLHVRRCDAGSTTTKGCTACVYRFSKDQNLYCSLRQNHGKNTKTRNRPTSHRFLLFLRPRLAALSARLLSRFSDSLGRRTTSQESRRPDCISEASAGALLGLPVHLPGASLGPPGALLEPSWGLLGPF